MNKISDIVELNVGGCYITTTLTTLTKYPDSMLAAMFSGRHQVAMDKEGRCFIDCDGELFKYILEYLRFESLPPSNKALQIYEYAQYFGIQTLVDQIKHFDQVYTRNQFKEAKSKLKTAYTNAKDQIMQNISRTNDLIILFTEGNWNEPKCIKNGFYVGTCKGTTFPGKTLIIPTENNIRKELADCIAYELCELGYTCAIRGAYLRKCTICENVDQSADYLKVLSWRSYSNMEDGWIKIN